jgi:hypothetical protein
VDLEKIPWPPGIPVTRWLQPFPLLAFLLCAPPPEVPVCREAFRQRGFACEEIGRIDKTGRLRARTGTRDVRLLDLARDRGSGLGSPAKTPDKGRRPLTGR